MAKLFPLAMMCTLLMICWPSKTFAKAHHSGKGGYCTIHCGNHIKRYKSGHISSRSVSRIGKVDMADNHSVNSYYKKNGTFVSSYHATNPNSTKNDNYSTQGNINPYTGAIGTKPADNELDGKW